MLLGALPTSFTKYWIDRFPRIISHSYHSLESCSGDPTFAGYYPIGYKFSKPNYFYEITDDFKPFDGTMKNRESPKRYNNRFRSMEYANFVMDRKSSGKSINTGPGLLGDPTQYFRTYKKGAYNFPRNLPNITNGLKNIISEITRSDDNPRRGSDESVPEGDISSDDPGNSGSKPEVEAEQEENFWRKRAEENNKIVAEQSQNASQNVQIVQNTPNVPVNKSQKQKIKHAKQPETVESENVEPKPEPDIDEEGFTKVRYRGSGRKHRDSQNENVPWVVPKEQK